MKCNKCGREFQNDVKFCPDCGDLVKDSKKIKTTVVVQSGTLDKDIFKTNTKGVKKEKLVIKQLIFSFIIPVFGILYVIINFLNGKRRNALYCGIAVIISVFLTFSINVFRIGFNMLDVTFEGKDKTDNYYQSTGQTEDDNQNTNSTIDTDLKNSWKNFQIVYAEETLTLPLEYSVLSEKTKFLFDESKIKPYIDRNSYLTNTMFKNDLPLLLVEVYNTNEEKALYKDCKVTMISQSRSHVKEEADDIIFPGNLKVGDNITEKDIISLFGRANIRDNRSSGIDYISYVFTYKLSETKFYRITIVNDVIEQLALKNR